MHGIAACRGGGDGHDAEKRQDEKVPGRTSSGTIQSKHAALIRLEMLDVANGRLIARLIPNARLEIMPGVGHLFWLEQPELSARLIVEQSQVSAAA